MRHGSNPAGEGRPATQVAVNERNGAGSSNGTGNHGALDSRTSVDTSPRRDGPHGKRPGVVRPRHRWLIEKLLHMIGCPPVAVTLWDGHEIRASERSPLATVVVHNAATLRRIVVDPFYQIAEAYTNGQIDILGDLVGAAEAFNRSLRTVAGTTFWNSIPTKLRLPRINSLSKSRDNVYHHYDIGNDFYELWLDEQLAYTCAYFPTPQATLEEAQVAKFDHVCRKVQLKPGERVVEAGCGWGGLALHMARHYGVTVRAYNVSREQIAHARKRAKQEGLDDRVEFIEDDWRNITGQYDAFVSVGMLEHVGKGYYRTLGEVIHRSLTDKGRGLVHSIGRNRPTPVDRWIERRIFPGSFTPSLSEMMRIFEPREFSVLDVENLRLHYAQTLRHWLSRFERGVNRVQELFDERFVRTWRLYLAGSVAAFETGELQLFQVLFARHDLNEMPITRDHLYAPQENAPAVAAEGA
ncbi:MAG: class I SAM-dependent methyltransferase [Planctomycetota bacterium]|nr:MAG: class I SAM-dependent methyltransferase [Planctomycetota bacterium]